MDIKTKYFGNLSLSIDDEIYFENGIFGFDNYKKFVIIRFDNESSNVLCLQSTEEYSLAFTIINPFYFIPDYVPVPLNSDLKVIDGLNKDNMLFYNICVIREELRNSTVNLRCPIIVNPENKKAIQVILEDCKYPFKYPFSDFIKED